MKKLLIGLIFTLAVISCKSQDSMKVIYVYDALCGWCYGFSPVMNPARAYSHHSQLHTICSLRPLVVGGY